MVADPAGLGALLGGLPSDAHDGPPGDDPARVRYHRRPRGRQPRRARPPRVLRPRVLSAAEQLLRRASAVRAPAPGQHLRRQGRDDEVAPIVARIRARWPRARIVVRGDSGCCHDGLMNWCEVNGVEFVLGLAKNERRKTLSAPVGSEVPLEHLCTGNAVPGLRRVHLSHPRLLESRTAGGREGRASLPRSGSALYGDLAQRGAGLPAPSTTTSPVAAAIGREPHP
jgi:hypothetical protein